MHSRTVVRQGVTALLFATLLTGCTTAPTDENPMLAQEDEFATPQESAVVDPLYIEQEGKYVDDYLIETFSTIDTTWGDVFEQQGLERPRVTQHIIMPGESAETDCEETYYADTPNAIACPDGTNQYSIWIPSQTFRAMWDGEAFGLPLSTANGFTATTVLAHEYGHVVVDSLGNQLAGTPDEMTAISDINHELISDCFAGIYLAAYNQVDRLSDDELAAAKELVRISGDDIPLAPGMEDNGIPHGTSKQRLAAFETGYQENAVDIVDVNACIDAYWH